jgi:dTDP-glucose pyrophosphorylase
MKDWKKTCISPDQSIKDAIRILDLGGLQIVLVIDAEKRLLGTITDGDIRRGILRELSLKDSVEEVMFRTPKTALVEQSKEAILSLMQRHELRQIPIVDTEGRVVGLKTLSEFLKKRQKENWVVIMAGGLGSRLGELTENCPKPLLEIGKKPLLETILLQFIEHGYHRFYFSLNYLADHIEAYFGDGNKWDVEIRYIHEKKRMGTAGALSLLSEVPQSPLIVMNGDVLTKVNFENLLDFHQEQGAKGTMCVREYDLQVPYGVIQIEKGRIKSIDEKPINKFFVNAGIYVLEPAILQCIPQNTFFDMPELFEQMLENQEETSVFPIREYWLDIGQTEDLNRANGEFEKIFASTDK